MLPRRSERGALVLLQSGVDAKTGRSQTRIQHDNGLGANKPQSQHAKSDENGTATTRFPELVLGSSHCLPQQWNSTWSNHSSTRRLKISDSGTAGLESRHRHRARHRLCAHRTIRIEETRLSTDDSERRRGPVRDPTSPATHSFRLLPSMAGGRRLGCFGSSSAALRPVSPYQKQTGQVQLSLGGRPEWPRIREGVGPLASELAIRRAPPRRKVERGRGPRPVCHGWDVT